MNTTSAELTTDLPVAGLPIICADGVQQGTAEAIDREYVRTTPGADGHRHFIPLDVVARVDGAVHLSLTHEQLLGLL